jgi:hypothetical protein
MQNIPDHNRQMQQRRWEAQQYQNAVAAQHVAAARAKSYTGPAILVLVLYLLMWLPGFIANILYYSDAKQTQRVAGYSLPGTGCLAVMLWLNVASLVLGLLSSCVVVVLGLLGIISLPFLAALGAQ